MTGQRPGSPLWADLAGIAVDLQPTEAQMLSAMPRPRRKMARTRASNSRGSTVSAVIVGAHFQTDDLVHGVAARGQYEDRNAAQRRQTSSLSSVGQHRSRTTMSKLSVPCICVFRRRHWRHATRKNRLAEIVDTILGQAAIIS